MHEIKEINLTETEKEFIVGSLALIEHIFAYRDIYNIQEIFASALKPVIDAEQIVLEENAGIEPIDKDGNYIDVDLELLIAQTEYTNFVTEIKRVLNIVNALNTLLDIVSSIVYGKQHEYSEKITELRKQIEDAIQKLNWCIVSGQKNVDEIKKEQNTWGILKKHENK